MAKHTLTQSELIAFNHAAAGHDGVLSDPSGSQVIKPCTPSEPAFYESAPLHPAFAAYIPTFMGTLSLSPHADPEAAAAAALTSTTPTPLIPAPTLTVPPSPNPAGAKKPDTQAPWTPSQGRNIDSSTAIVLSNAAYGFTHPNILDVKLGARLWAPDAPLSKRARLDKVAAETTSASLGFRVAGMRVWQDPSSTTAGKDIPPGKEGGGADAEGYKVYGKDYGRALAGREDVKGVLEEFLGIEGAGVSRELGRKVAGRLRDVVEGMVGALGREESRMFSASVLFVCEGDGKLLESAFEDEEEEEAERRKRDGGKREDGNNVGDDEEDEEEDEDEDEDEVRGPYIAVAKLIDFAHASWTPGQGPDENVLQGLRNVLGILEELSAT
ncbi:MAG: hypothetical protein M1830_001963 [Pleopsidium flavum]|nr:MAG: hypothetical protein M1830_001963 [Pleopsidium flavum]